jgi:hypothetical protein
MVRTWSDFGKVVCLAFTISVLTSSDEYVSKER